MLGQAMTRTCSPWGLFLTVPWVSLDHSGAVPGPLLRLLARSCGPCGQASREVSARPHSILDSQDEKACPEAEMSCGSRCTACRCASPPDPTLQPRPCSVPLPSRPACLPQAGRSRPAMASRSVLVMTSSGMVSGPPVGRQQLRLTSAAAPWGVCAPQTGQPGLFLPLTGRACSWVGRKVGQAGLRCPLCPSEVWAARPLPSSFLGLTPADTWEQRFISTSAES